MNGQSSAMPSSDLTRKSEGNIRTQCAAHRTVLPPTPLHINGLTSDSDVSQG